MGHMVLEFGLMVVFAVMGIGIVVLVVLLFSLAARNVRLREYLDAAQAKNDALEREIAERHLADDAARMTRTLGRVLPLLTSAEQLARSIERVGAHIGAQAGRDN